MATKTVGWRMYFEALHVAPGAKAAIRQSVIYIFRPERVLLRCAGFVVLSARAHLKEIYPGDGPYETTKVGDEYVVLVQNDTTETIDYIGLIEGTALVP